MNKKLSQTELAARLETAAAQVTVGATYRHFKGKSYKVIAIALDELTCRPHVVYQALYGENLVWSRQLSSWTQPTETGNRRFHLIRET